MSSITTVSDATIWSITYDHHYDDRNGFIIQAKIYWLDLHVTYTWLTLDLHLTWQCLPRTLAHLPERQRRKKKSFITLSLGLRDELWRRDDHAHWQLRISVWTKDWKVFSSWWAVYSKFVGVDQQLILIWSSFEWPTAWANVLKLFCPWFTDFHTKLEMFPKNKYKYSSLLRKSEFTDKKVL